jgi:hypothetical protein
VSHVKICPFALGLLVAGLGFIYLIDGNLPVHHSAEVTTGIPNASPQQVLALICQVARYSKWRPGVEVSNVSRDAAGVHFREAGPDGALSYVQTSSGSTVTNTTTGRNLAFGRQWPLWVTAIPNGTAVRIREDGFIRPPLFRFLARYVFGYQRSLQRFSAQLTSAASRTELP